MKSRIDASFVVKSVTIWENKKIRKKVLQFGKVWQLTKSRPILSKSFFFHRKSKAFLT